MSAVPGVPQIWLEKVRKDREPTGDPPIAPPKVSPRAGVGMNACGFEVRVNQARKNAAWWRGELATGRKGIDRETVESLLRDLETAGGAQYPAPARPPQPLPRPGRDYDEVKKGG